MIPVILVQASKVCCIRKYDVLLLVAALKLPAIRKAAVDPTGAFPFSTYIRISCCKKLFKFFSDLSEPHYDFCSFPSSSWFRTKTLIKSDSPSRRNNNRLLCISATAAIKCLSSFLTPYLLTSSASYQTPHSGHPSWQQLYGFRADWLGGVNRE